MRWYKTIHPEQVASERSHQPHTFGIHLHISSNFIIPSPSHSLIFILLSTRELSNMNQNLTPVSRDPNQTLPSFRELEATIEANILEDNKIRLENGEDLTPNASAFASPHPPYPAHGFHLPTDVSQHVCFIYQYISRQDSDLSLGISQSRIHLGWCMYLQPLYKRDEANIDDHRPLPTI